MTHVQKNNQLHNEMVHTKQRKLTKRKTRWGTPVEANWEPYVIVLLGAVRSL